MTAAVIAYVLFHLFAWSLCRAAADADRLMSEFARNRREPTR